MKFYTLPLALLLFFHSTVTKAQRVNYSKIIDSSSVDTAERLVVIAWRNNPDNKQLEDNAEATRYDFHKASVNWLNEITAAGNVNEFTIHPNQVTSQYYYPRYNLGIVLPLGIFWSQPAETKSARKRWQASVEKVNSQKMDIRNKVLNSYQDYHLNRELLKLQNRITADSYIEYISKQNKFKSGEIGADPYTATERKYFAELANRLTLEHNVNISKYNLERLIGLKLDDAFRLMR